MLFPAAIMCFLRRYINEKEWENKQEDLFQYIIEYIISCVIINTLLLTILVFVVHNNQNVFENLNHYNDFAVKYLYLSIVVAIIEPFLEKEIKAKYVVSIQISHTDILCLKKNQTIIMWGLIIIALVFYFIRIGGNDFWGDEAFPIHAAYMGMEEMLKYVATTGHSPLHYVVFWIGCHVLGYSPVVFHFVSVFPYLMIVVITVVFVRKWFGTEVAITLILMCSFLNNAIRYNLEARMYSWCQLFILLSYLMVYRILMDGRLQFYLLLTFFSACSVYAHYFALIPISVLYLFIFLYNLKIKNQRNILAIICSGFIFLLMFLPWFSFSYTIRQEWLPIYSSLDKEQHTWFECFAYIFYSKYSIYILLFFITILLLAFLKDFEFVKYTRTENHNKKINIDLNLKNIYSCTNEWLWIFSGVTAVLGIIILPKVFSSLFGNIITMRYLYPAFIIIWLLLGVIISKYKSKELLVVFLSIMIFFTCLPTCFQTLKSEWSNNKRLANTLEATAEIDADDYIITENNWSLMMMNKVYYRNTSSETLYSIEELSIDNAKNNWLFLMSPISQEIIDRLADQNCSVKLIVDNGHIASKDVWIYKVIPKGE